MYKQTPVPVSESLPFTIGEHTFYMIKVAGNRNTGIDFRMGSEEYDDEKPIRSVTIEDFWIGQFPVTQALWEAVMHNNPSHFKGGNLPVENVSWNDIRKDKDGFLAKLNKMMEEKKEKIRFRLPSEAEWEYAARGGLKGIPNACRFSGSNLVEEVAWFEGNNDIATMPVGLKAPNELGLYDMSGNVWEWCEDTWHQDYKGAPKDGSAWVDKNSSHRVIRGGSWRNYGRFCRITNRLNFSPGLSRNTLGFRLIASSSFS